MNTLTVAETLKDCRAIAAKNGLTFKREDFTINGAPAYKFVTRASGQLIRGSLTLGLAYEIACSGELES